MRGGIEVGGGRFNEGRGNHRLQVSLEVERGCKRVTRPESLQLWSRQRVSEAKMVLNATREGVAGYTSDTLYFYKYIH